MSSQAFPPAYYSLPRYSTTLWNYSQMIKLTYSPVVSVERISYIAPDGTTVDMLPGTPENPNGQFVVDTANEPARIFPNPGSYWPPCLYVPNAVAIHYTAGYGTDPRRVPAVVAVAMRQLIRFWDEAGSAAGVPESVKSLLSICRVLDVAPTRG